MGEHFHNDAGFTLPNHVEQNFSPFESAEKLADYFSHISQIFEPISIERFSPSIQEKLKFGLTDSAKPVLQPWQVYRKIRSSKKPNSLVPGDLPVKLVNEFDVELAEPVCKIFNKITNTAQYPRQWVTEFQTAIPKCPQPLSEDDTRNIAKTAYFSKVYESFIGDWIFPYIKPFLDPAQCGGLKKSSITHYLVKLLHFIHKHIDIKQPHAVLLVLVDLEKAFNRVSHQLVIEDLAAMKVPGWLLLILISYLSGRSMVMQYEGVSSTVRDLPGSSPQGAFLGVLLFLILFNGALLRPAVPRPMSLNLKYIDDLSLAFAVNLTKDLITDQTYRQRPLTFDQRNSTVLPPDNVLQADLKSLYQFTTRKQMKIKESKTNIIKFNFSRNHDFPAEFIIPGFHEKVTEIEETKLLGIMLSSDLRWEANTSYICRKAYKKMWILRRLRKLNPDIEFLLDVYTKEVRSHLEFAVPAWHGGLSKKHSDEIERVQKVAVSVILGKEVSYSAGLKLLNIEELSVRRERLCLNFAKKTLKSQHSSMFTRKMKEGPNTRFKQEFSVNKCNTQRYYNFPINYLTRLLNNN